MSKGRSTGRIVGVASTVAARCWPMADGEELALNVDGAPASSFTCSAGPAVAYTSAVGGSGFAVSNGQTIKYKVGPRAVTERPEKTITISGIASSGHGTIDELFATIAAQVDSAELTITHEGGGAPTGYVQFVTVDGGTDVELIFTGGAALVATGLSGVDAFGYGNVAAASEVSLEEVQAGGDPWLSTLDADYLGHAFFECLLVGAAHSVQVLGVTAARIAGAARFGFDLLVHAGVDAGTPETMDTPTAASLGTPPPVRDAVDWPTRLAGRVYEQFKESNWAVPTAEAIGAGASELDRAAAALALLFSIEPVTDDPTSPLYGVGRGVQLNRIGKLVGQARGGADDGLYRLILRARILVNKSNGVTDELIAMLQAMLPGVNALYRDGGTAAFTMALLGVSVDPLEAAAALSLLRSAKQAGVRALIEWQPADDGLMFAFDSDGAGGLGYGDATDRAVGGAYAGAAK